MKGNSMNLFNGFIMPLALGLIAAGIVYAVVNGKPFLFISGPRAGMIALFIVGLAMCSGGIGQVGMSGRWTSPLAILGYLLGALILVIFLSVFTGWKLPWIEGGSQAVVAVAVLMAVKFLIGSAGFFLRLL
jgi:hypothetical protein